MLNHNSQIFPLKKYAAAVITWFCFNSLWYPRNCSEGICSGLPYITTHLMWTGQIVQWLEWEVEGACIRRCPPTSANRARGGAKGGGKGLLITTRLTASLSPPRAERGFRGRGTHVNTV